MKDEAIVLESRKKKNNLTTEPGVSEVSKDMGVMRKEERKKNTHTTAKCLAPPLHVVWAYKVLLGQRAYRTEGQSGEGWPQGQWEREPDKEGRVVVSVKCQGAVTEAPN